MRKIIGVTGRIGSGKDTIAEYLIDNHGFKKFSFASSLKDFVSVVFGWPRDMLEGNTKDSREWREQIDTWWAKRLDMPHLTPRWVMQHLGTEILRNHFHQDIWMASLEKRLISYDGDVVITDCRFFNELSLIRQLDGTLVRVERGQIPNWYNDAKNYNTGKAILPPVGIHASEYSSVGYDYDYNLDNNSNLEDLYKIVEQILIHGHAHIN